MLKQYVSVSDVGRPNAASTALSPQPSRDGIRVVDHNLQARLMRAAAASGLPPPTVVPGAAVLLLALDLPLRSGRKQRAAAPFAIEPFLAADLKSTHVAVGPALQGTVRLCAALRADDLQDWLAPGEAKGAVVPDLCAVPMPTAPEAWSLWCGAEAVYVRTSEGGCVFAHDGFADLWRALGRPSLELWHGAAPPGVEIARHHKVAPEVPASTFELDMRPDRSAHLGPWRNRLGFAAGVCALAGIAHAAVIAADASALERTAMAQRAALIDHVATRGVSIDMGLPASALTADLIARATQTDRADPFLNLLANAGSAMAGSPGIAFRDLQYDASSRTLTISLTAPDLAALQQAENALRAGEMTVTSGAASTDASGAEIQLILSEAG